MAAYDDHYSRREQQRQMDRIRWELEARLREKARAEGSERPTTAAEG